MPEVKLIVGRTYSVVEKNLNTNRMFTSYLWRKNGDIVTIPPRYMNHMDVRSGIKRGILKVLEEQKKVLSKKKKESETSPQPVSEVMFSG